MMRITPSSSAIGVTLVERIEQKMSSNVIIEATLCREDSWN